MAAIRLEWYTSGFYGWIPLMGESRDGLFFNIFGEIIF